MKTAHRFVAGLAGLVLAVSAGRTGTRPAAEPDEGSGVFSSMVV